MMLIYVILCVDLWVLQMCYVFVAKNKKKYSTVLLFVCLLCMIVPAALVISCCDVWGTAYGIYRKEHMKYVDSVNL